MQPTHVGVYQRPAPPKRPLGLNSPKTAQKPLVPLHEIEAQARTVIESIVTARRKPGRPSINERPMTPAERQAKRRADQAREQAIREALEIGDAHGKSHAEARSGGYDSQKLDTMEGLRELEGGVDDEGVERGKRKRVAPKGESSVSDEKSYQDVLDSGGSFHRGGGLEPEGVEENEVCDLQIGDEESNRQRFAESELRKMVGEYFTSPEKSPSASWTAKHSGNNSVQHHVHLSIALTCKLCADSMESIEDAKDHLRVDHRTNIDGWFRTLMPRREFRDMENFVTVVMPRKRTRP